jgi:hypothetical protein
MITFLFWNLNRKPLVDTLATLTSRHDVDVLILTECAVTPDAVLLSINGRPPSRYQYAPGIGCRKVEVFVRFLPEFVRPVFETDRLTIRRLVLPGLNDLLLAAVHSPSKLHWRDSSQAIECVDLAESIRREEARAGHGRTLLVGDLNMNPFEDGMVAAKGLHGVMSRSIAARGTRVVQGKEYPFFYNPMWSLLGDRETSPPGTYYYDNAEHTVFFWNMFDQVLVRPELLPHFELQDLSIVQSDGCNSFLCPSGVPDADNFSDHLPIVFGLRL